MKSASFRNEEGIFVLEGLRLCMDAVLNRAQITTAFYTQKFADKFPDDAEKVIRTASENFCVSDTVFQKLSDTMSPQGIICLCKIPKSSLKPQKGKKYIILENISDPSNTGAIARTAEALGLDGMFVSGGCDIYSPKALRASMGALVRFPSASCSNISNLIADFKSQSIPCFAAVVSNPDCTVSQVEYTNGAAVIIGNEANGVTDSTKALCDKCITIPMKGRAESLNAAAAAAILIYEMTSFD